MGLAWEMELEWGKASDWASGWAWDWAQQRQGAALIHHRHMMPAQTRSILPENCGGKTSSQPLKT